VRGKVGKTNGEPQTSKKATNEQESQLSSIECILMLQSAEENLELIRKNFSLTITNRKKNVCWDCICKKVNALGVCKKDHSNIREKWRAMRNEACKEMT
jgi:hypothetical protein